MNSIENIVKKYKINEIQEELNKDRENILKLKRKLSDLKLNRNVALYAYSLDKILYMEETSKYIKIKNELEGDTNVIEYIKLKEQLDNIYNKIADYYYFIQIDLREKLTDIEYPDTYIHYVSYGEELLKNIIDNELIEYDENNAIIYPPKEIKSNRKNRHFYNRTSFKYLEALTKDYSFSLEEKDLGKVKVKRP